MTRVATSALRPVIYLDGRDKREATDDVLLAVADYAQRHFGGYLRAEYIDTDGGPDLTIEVRVIEEGPQGRAEGHERPQVPESGVRRSQSRSRTGKGHVSPDPAQQIHDHENGDTR